MGFGWLLAIGLLMAPAAAMAAGAQAAEALIAQGNQSENQGDHEGAISAYGQAIALSAGADPTYEALIDRAFAYASSKHFAEAFQDLDRAHALKPTDTATLSARYWFDFELYQFPAAITIIDQMNGMSPADPYAPLLRFIATARLGQDTSSVLAKTLTPATENLWPQAAAQMFLGKVTPDTLLGWVQESGNQQASCEAPFYAGEYFLIHQQQTLAQAAFQETQRDECRPVSEYYAAQNELASLSSSAQ